MCPPIWELPKLVPCHQSGVWAYFDIRKIWLWNYTDVDITNLILKKKKINKYHETGINSSTSASTLLITKEWNFFSLASGHSDTQTDYIFISIFFKHHPEPLMVNNVSKKKEKKKSEIYQIFLCISS